MPARVIVPPRVRRGQPFEVRVTVRHPMETGFRRDLEGKLIPLDIIDRLACRYGGREVFRVEPGTGIGANPYFLFYVVAGDSGELEVEWHDDRGAGGRASAQVVVG
jgi:sulfur-oxidizing protein SoxZ